jgi:ABC-2 type transport system ATP-binding protein
MREIVADKLCKRIAGREILKNASLTVERGVVYGLLGRNGAGKTTLIKHLVGLLRPDAGAARVLGNEMFGAGASARQAIAYVSEGVLYPTWARVGDIIEFERICRTRFDGQRMDTWLATHQIERAKKISALSKGESKRLELEIAFSTQPKVLILDEPFSGLDPISRAEAIEVLIDHVTGGACAILSSHVLSDMERLCERFGVLAHGRIVVEIEVDDLKNGGAIVSAASLHDLSDVKVLASRSAKDGVMAVVSGLVDDSHVSLLEAAGVTVQRGALDELGVELIRCAEQGD